MNEDAEMRIAFSLTESSFTAFCCIGVWCGVSRLLSHSTVCVYDNLLFPCQIDAALAPGYPEDQLANGFRMTIKRSDMATLNNLNWLNDEVL